MKIHIRAKHGQPAVIYDENNKPIEGLIDFKLHACGKGELPTVALLIQAPALVIDAEASVTEQPAAPASETPTE